MARLSIAAACALAACASPEPRAPITVRVPVEVAVPTPVPCVAAADVPAAPQLATDAELAALSDYALVLTIEAQRRELRAHQIRLAAIVAACVQPGMKGAATP